MSNAKTEIIALANYSDFSKTGQLSLNGIFDRIYTEDFPTIFRGFLVFTVKTDQADKSIKLKVLINDPANKKILKKDVVLPLGPTGKANFVAELLGMPLDSEGEYRVSLFYADSEIGKTTFSVIKRDGKKEESTSAKN